MRAIVLGCGPAGLMATHALASNGHDVLVFSRKRKSEMYGAQYLHMPIPGMTEKPGRNIYYDLRGTVDEYREKVYGPKSRVKVSPEDLSQDHVGWDIRSTYDNLWDTYSDYVQDYSILPGDIAGLKLRYQPDVIFSTIPAHLLCLTLENEEPVEGPHVSPHTFAYEEVWAIGDAPERGVFCPVSVDPDHVVCNGESAPAWYRAANVFNRKTAEWPADKKPPIRDVSLIRKPLFKTCTCHPDVVRLGRFGKWQKGVLSHTAYTETLNIVQKAGVQGTLL